MRALNYTTLIIALMFYSAVAMHSQMPAAGSYNSHIGITAPQQFDDKTPAVAMYYSHSRDTVAIYTGSQLASQDVKYLYLSDDPTPDYCAHRCIKRAYFKVILHATGTARKYLFGRSTFFSKVNFQVQAMNGSIGLPVLADDSLYIGVSSDSVVPEKILVGEFTVNHPYYCGSSASTADRLKITIQGYTAPIPSEITDLIRMEVHLIEEFAVDAVKEGTSGCASTNHMIETNGLSGTNPVTFRWKNKTSCPNDSFPNYQFQLLRLFNLDTAFRNNENKISAVVDWSKALIAETYGPKQQITLTLAEGTGFYIWRVRPIGDRYNNGIGNDSNWGCWTISPPDTSIIIEKSGATITPSLYSNCIFYYQQFDDPLNWIYGRTFTEGKDSRPGVSESMTYANGLLQGRQTQKHMMTNDSVLVNSTIYDFSGRPSLQTLAAPVQQGKIEYVDDLVLDNTSSLYRDNDFDDNGNYLNPSKVYGGPITSYYSNQNIDITIPSADSLPFTRTLYYPDASGRIMEQGGVGQTHRVGNTHTVRTMYSIVNDKELVSVFGDEAPNASSVGKIITTDPNGVSSVQYVSKDGKVLATCLVKNSSGNTLLMPLDETANTLSLIDTINNNTRYGENGIIASKRIPLQDSAGTNVVVNYQLTKKQIELACESYCSYCDYRVIRSLRRIIPDTALIFRDTTTIKAALCNTTNVFSKSTLTFNLLPKGEYIAERIITSFVPDTLVVSGDTTIRSTLDKHIDSVRNWYSTRIRMRMDTIFGVGPLGRYYGNPTNERIYDTLLTNYVTYYNNLPSGNKTISLNSCCSVTLPKSQCQVGCISGSPQDFEGYLYDMWADTLGKDRVLNSFFFNADGTAKYTGSGVATTGLFNSLVNKMISEGGYDCQDLWRCWEGLVSQYRNIAFEKDTNGDFILFGGQYKYNKGFDLLDAFLTCTGKKYCGFVTNATGANNYYEYAWRTFKYSTADDSCWYRLKYAPGDTAWTCGAGRDSLVHSNYRKLYECTHGDDLNSTFADLKSSGKFKLPNAECNGGPPDNNCLIKIIESMTDSCMSACEARRPVFERNLIIEYLKNGYHVEGYTYRMTPVPPLKEDTIPRAIITCQVNELVENCTNYCDITIYDHYNGATRIIDSIGNSNQFSKMQKALHSTFEIQLPNEQDSCGSEYDRVGSTGVGGNTALLVALNDALKLYRDTMQTGFAVWNYYPVIKQLKLQYSQLLTCTDSTKFKAQISKADSSYFTIIQSGNNCILSYQPPAVVGTSTALDSANHPLVAFLNNYLDSVWAKRIRATTASLSVTDSCTTAFLMTPDYYTWYQGSLSSFDPLVRNWYQCYDPSTMSLKYCDVMFPCVNGKKQVKASDIVSITSASVHFFRLSPGDDSVSITGSIKFKFMPSSMSPFNMLVELKKNICSTGNLTSILVHHSFNGVNDDLSYPTSPTNTELTNLLGQYTGTIGYFYASENRLFYKNILTSKITEIPLSGTGKALACDSCSSGLEEVCVLEDCSSSCGAVCFRWADDPNVIPNYTLSYKSCAKQAIEYLIPYLEGKLYGECVQEAVNKLTDEYEMTCTNPDSLNDVMTVSHDVVYEHYTLYYYDRAGNLVKTVPPAGVHFLTGSSLNRSNHPLHTMATIYEYNSLGQLVRQYTPDGDTSKFWYDGYGRVRLSQNAKQKPSNQYSYTQYDDLGRIVEVGEIADIGNPQTLADTQTFPTSGGTQLTRTFYTDKPSPSVTFSDGSEQRYLQNRVSYTYTDVDGLSGATDRVYTYYSYDPHGNVEWLVQDIPDLGKNYIRYEYDLISGKVTKVEYQKNKPDRFFQRYEYDFDNRLVGVETSRDGWIWESDARYKYYAHGPLRRVELGTDWLQGIDYTYTIQGWLKGINHPTLDPQEDPGKDGKDDNYAVDAFGMILGYFEGDFNRSSSQFNSAASGAQTYNLNGNPLYNGNITSWTSQIQASGASGLVFEQLVGERYQYDLLNRLRSAYFDYWNAKGGVGWKTGEKLYQSFYEYDPNGNIATLMRYRNDVRMDDLTYYYYDSTGHETNRLRRIADSQGAGTVGDIGNQAITNNYRYDTIGNLIADSSEGIPLGGIVWNVYGKMQQVQEKDSTLLKFFYDATGNRVKKEVWKYSGGSYSQKGKFTWYVRDAGGNPLGTYEKDYSAGDTAMYLAEVPLYGSDRLGLATLHQKRYGTTPDTLGKFGRYLDKKLYELKDHLGNVRVTISDIKLLNDKEFIADMTSYNNYYPFGMLQPERNWKNTGSKYRYGFNGQEKIDEILGEGNHNTALFWEYDTRIARRWNIDVVVKPFQSGYSAFSNNPIIYVDPDGNTDYYNNRGVWIGRDGDDNGKKQIALTNTTAQFIREATGRHEAIAMDRTVYKDLLDLPSIEFMQKLDEAYTLTERSYLEVAVVQGGSGTIYLKQSNSSTSVDIMPELIAGGESTMGMHAHTHPPLVAPIYENGILQTLRIAGMAEPSRSGTTVDGAPGDMEFAAQFSSMENPLMVLGYSGLQEHFNRLQNANLDQVTTILGETLKGKVMNPRNNGVNLRIPLGSRSTFSEVHRQISFYNANNSSIFSTSYSGFKSLVTKIRNSTPPTPDSTSE